MLPFLLSSRSHAVKIPRFRVSNRLFASHVTLPFANQRIFHTFSGKRSNIAGWKIQRNFDGILPRKLKILFSQWFVSLPFWESPRLVEVELPEPWTSFKGVGSVVCYLNNELGHLRRSDDQFGKRFFSWERPWMKQRHGGFLLVKRRCFILKNGWCLLWMGGGSFMSHQKR